jgi:hypothetical protein
MALSESTVSGKEDPKTLKIKGSIQHLQILVLIDSSNSHYFVSE